MRAITKQEMPLEIPLRKVGNSLMITIPSDIARLYGLKEGVRFEVVPDKEMFLLKVSKKSLSD